MTLLKTDNTYAETTTTGAESGTEEYQPAQFYDIRRGKAKQYVLRIAYRRQARGKVAVTFKPMLRDDDSDAKGLDLKATEASLLAYATQRGVDLDALLKSAAKHFRPNTITPRTAPLTNRELDSLADDDLRAFDD